MKKFNEEDIEKMVVTDFLNNKITIYYAIINNTSGLFVSIRDDEIDFCGKFKNNVFGNIRKKVKNGGSVSSLYNQPKYKWEKLYLTEMIDYIIRVNKNDYKYAENFKIKLNENNLKIMCRYDWIS